ncbi:MAG: sugar ABC transporter ATP-binding protein [Synergistaceae bacterium]|jgi:ABC-type sugar transport system ATPase subunit|nr:sugar ABC transporter ATP-binding protein [Synergistaceae bacterium]
MANFLELKNISKSFASNSVLKDVNLDIREGETHALIGENGAGKSTLIKIIGGIYQADSGEILAGGVPIHCATPIQAMEKGISIVHQELSLAQNLSVAENIFTGREIVNKIGFIRWGVIDQRSREIFDKIGIEINPGDLVGTLSVGMQQVVEIAKAISLNARVILMDEPTSSLSEKEIERLFALIRELRKRNVAIVYVSHKIGEVMEIADRVSVLRDGNLVFTKEIADTSVGDIINAMVGREISNIYPVRSENIGDVVLECKGLTRFGYFHDVSFSVRKGEILGFYGLIGAGRSEVARAVVGADERTAGDIYIDGVKTSLKNPESALRNGVAYLTEDRKQLGLFLDYSVTSNIVSSSPEKFTRKSGFIDMRRADEIAGEVARDLTIKTESVGTKAVFLSGGNQQKLLLGKWILPHPRVLIVDEPTRGVDVGAKALIHQKLRELADGGMALIVISSEMPEIMGMSDTLAVFREGRLVDILDNSRGQVSQNDIMERAVR